MILIDPLTGCALRVEYAGNEDAHGRFFAFMDGAGIERGWHEVTADEANRYIREQTRHLRTVSAPLKDYA